MYYIESPSKHPLQHSVPSASAAPLLLSVVLAHRHSWNSWSTFSLCFSPLDANQHHHAINNQKFCLSCCFFFFLLWQLRPLWGFCFPESWPQKESQPTSCKRQAHPGQANSPSPVQQSVSGPTVRLRANTSQAGTLTHTDRVRSP